MTLRNPLVINAGRVQQLQDTDLLELTGSSHTNDNAGALVIGAPVYVKSNGNIDKAQADAEATSFVVGLVKDASIASTASGQVQTDDIFEATTAQWDVVTGGSGGLIPGSYYLSSTAAGQLTTTAPTNGFVVRVGIALSTTRMAINIGVPSAELDVPLTFLVNGGRLSVTSGDPFGAGTSATVYFMPTLSNTLTLYNGTQWVLHEFSEVNVAVPSTRFQAFDVFVFDNSGTITLETQNWSTNSGAVTGATNASPIVITSVAHGRSNNDLLALVDVGGNTAPNDIIWQIANVTADTFELRGSTGNGTYTSGGTWIKVSGQTNSGVTTQDGISVQTGDATKRYVGSGFTTATSGSVVVGNAIIGLNNRDNQDLRATVLTDSNSHTYATGAIRPWNDDGSLNIIIMTPVNARTNRDVSSSVVLKGDVTAEAVSVIAVDGFTNAQLAVVGNTNSSFIRTNGISLGDSSADGGVKLYYLAENRFNGAGTATFNQMTMRIVTEF